MSSNSHDCRQQRASALFPTESSSHSLDSTYHVIFWNAQCFGNKHLNEHSDKLNEFEILQEFK